MRVIGFGAAVLFATAAASKTGPSVTYSCPKGWELSGENCVRSVPVKPITTTDVSFTDAEPIKSCPRGYSESGSQCAKTESVSKIVKMITESVPSKVCPKGATQSKNGCVISRTVTSKYAETSEKQVSTQRVTKTSEFVSVKKPVAVPIGPNCPKGAEATKTGCIVKTPIPSYELAEVSKTLRIPKDDKVVAETCFTGETRGPCAVLLTGPNQSVKENTSQKTVQVPQLADKPKTVTLKSKVKVAKQVCPQGSQSGPEGCVVVLTKQVLTTKSNTKPVPAGAGATTEVKKSLKVGQTTLVPSYKCPTGSVQKSEHVCLVTRTKQVPVTSEVQKTVKVGHAAKSSRTIKVPKAVAVTGEPQCPKGAEKSTSKSGRGDACVIKTKIQIPYTEEKAITQCPAGAIQDSGACFFEKKVYVAAVEVPSGSKAGKGQSGVTMECPAGTEKDSVGLCFHTKYESVASETLIESKIQYRNEEIVTEVPALTTYTTSTVYEDATVEEIHIEYDTETVTEVVTSLESQTVTEEVPAIATWSSETTYEDVEVQDTVACGGEGGKGAGCDGGPSSLTETLVSVETITEREVVPFVTAWVVEEHVETENAVEQVVVNVPTTVTETRHTLVGTACGNGSQSTDCTKIVPLNSIVTFSGGFDTITVTEKRAKATTAIHEDEIHGTPAYRTEFASEAAEAVKIEVQSVPITLTVSEIMTKTQTLSEEVEAGPILKPSAVMREVCPDDAVQTEKGCEKTVVAPLNVACPPGSQMRHGSCVTKTSHTSTVCPPGSTESGSGCVEQEVLPAFADIPTEHPAPKKEAPAPSKKSLRM